MIVTHLINKPPMLKVFHGVMSLIIRAWLDVWLGQVVVSRLPTSYSKQVVVNDRSWCYLNKVFTLITLDHAPYVYCLGDILMSFGGEIWYLD